jgi:C-terminal processing protease CtpA/Prc
MTVNTMMGLDTIERIQDAYQAIDDQKAKALIIDLRSNDGGAFAVNPLVSHVIDKPLDAGFFISQKWTKDHSNIPTPVDVEAVEPWQGWSIRTFWRDVQENDITRITFMPAEPNFTGPVYVLTSSKTASAAELGADALLASGRAVLVGEPTAGQMLSQKMYDIEGGFQLYLPVADYFSIRSGHIEGNGVNPTLWGEAEEAMDKALSLARQQE